jgi:hypothetical protein
MPGQALSARKLVARGNRSYAAGEYDQALQAYDEASVTEPESPWLYFNRGAVHFQKGDLNAAQEAFQKAASKSKDVKLEAKCRYNLGNCAFRESERQRDSDLKKSLEACEKSIALYREALKLDTELKDAARNLEVARLTLKAILDEIRKREEEAAKQQQAQKQAVEKLQELIKRQEQALAQNESLAKEKSEKGEDAALQGKVQSLAGEQKDICQKTGQLADSMAQQPPPAAPPPAGQKQAPPQIGPQPATPADQAREHLNNAVQNQEAATQKLEQSQLEPAQPDQKDAAENLKKALAAMASPQQGQPQGGQDRQKQDQKEQQGEQAQGQQQQNAEDRQKQQQAAVADEKAHDILNEEKENREARRQPAGGYTAVDKDW